MSTRSRLAVVTACTLLLLPALAAGPTVFRAWVFARLDLPSFPDAEPPPPLRSVSAATCGGCHPQQLADWAATRMGQAMTDPVFLAEYRAQGEPFACLACHAPLPDQQPLVVTGLASVRPLVGAGTPNPTFDAALQAEGVTCVVCHLDQGVLVGPEGARSPHPTRADSDFGSADLCEPCHQVPIPPATWRLDRPLADTHAEWLEWKARTGRTETCRDCHMPDGRHTFPGAFDAPLLREGLGASVEVRGSELIVRMENRAGHRYPTAEPARAVSIRHGDAEQVLARRVPLPRFIDEGDSTLLPDETRALVFPHVPGAPVMIAMQPTRFLAEEVPVPEIVIHALEVP